MHREGMVTVYDHHGHYLGCMGTAKWQQLLTDERKAQMYAGITDITNEPGTSWEIVDGVLKIRRSDDDEWFGKTDFVRQATLTASSALAGARSCVAAAEMQLRRGVNSPEDADRVRGQADDAARALGAVSEAMLSLVVTGPVA